MQEFSVNASVDEWNVLIGMLDAFTKAEGLKVALAVGFWDRKIKEAAEAAAKAEQEAADSTPKLVVGDTPKEE